MNSLKIPGGNSLRKYLTSAVYTSKETNACCTKKKKPTVLCSSVSQTHEANEKNSLTVNGFLMVLDERYGVCRHLKYT